MPHIQATEKLCHHYLDWKQRKKYVLWGRDIPIRLIQGSNPGFREFTLNDVSTFKSNSTKSHFTSKM